MILIYIEDKSNPFYFQKRIGYRGEIFTMFKLRTMHNKQINMEHKKYYCFEDDPRITNIGKFLRKYSFDEFPQFFNVLIGDMSLVGPRPPVHDELDYETIDDINMPIINERRKVRPGITGYAQIKSRNDLTWNQKLELDHKYLSYKPFKRLLVDFKILLLTFYEIFSSKGIYDKKI
tara:strand:- start:1426 stop:1953 length:528 start_codon:yes stop_codon:yes gene_type:complete